MAGAARQAVLDIVMRLNRIYFRPDHGVYTQRTWHAGAGIFTGCRRTRMTADWDLHATRLQIPERYRKAVLQAILLCSTPHQHRHAKVRIVRDHPDSIAVTSGFLRHPPARFVLTPHAGTWPDYSCKYTDRKAFGRAGPCHRGSERHERLLVDKASGQIIETDTANILIHLDGDWSTPDWQATTQGLHGTELWKQRKRMQLVFRPIHMQDLTRASALAVCNAIVGVRPAILRQDAS